MTDRKVNMAASEKKRVLRWEKEQQTALNVRAQQIEDLTQLAKSQIDTAKELNRKAVKTINAALSKTHDTVDQIEEYKKVYEGDLERANLELQENTNAVFDELRVQADKHRQKVQRDKAKLESQKDSMIAIGLNPYVEFRKEKFEVEAKNRQTRMLNAVEENKADLSVQLLGEESAARKEEIKALREWEYEKAYRDAQDRRVVEEKTTKYINATLSNHNDIIDATGKKANIFPSKITDVPDFSFGLGKSSRIPPENMLRITNNIREKLKVSADEVGEYGRLLSKYEDLNPSASLPFNRSSTSTGILRVQSNATMSDVGEAKSAVSEMTIRDGKIQEMQQLAGIAGVMPGADSTAARINMPMRETEYKKVVQIAVEDSGRTDVPGRISTARGDEVKYPIPELSKFEKDSLERAKAEQKRRFTQGGEQVAGGRVFKGKGFVSKPSILEFKDFEVGKTYKKRFVLTNASYTFNSFRLLNLTDDVIDFFDIVYEKPGRVSAGVSCVLDITFFPKTNNDIFTALKFLTETGPVEVPVHCLIKRCAPVLVVPSIDFGPVVCGQVVVVPLKIKNTEALPSRFSVLRIEPVPTEQPAEVDLFALPATAGKKPSLSDSPFENMTAQELKASVTHVVTDLSASSPAVNDSELWHRVKSMMTLTLRQKKVIYPFSLSIEPLESEVTGYNETSVQVTCAPLTTGFALQEFQFTFHDVNESMKTVDQNGNLIKKNFVIPLQCTGLEVPIYLAEEVVDVQCCMHGRIYRTRVELCSRGKSACRVDIKVPSPMNKYVEVSPSMLFVQAGGSQVVNVRFTPTATMLHDLKHLTLPYEDFLDAAKFAIPVEMKVVGQDLPVFFVVKGDVCSSLLEFSTQSLEYGKAYISQESTMPLVITNKSMLPQKVAFVKLPKEVTVDVNEGFYCLLPNESVTFNVTFSPKSVVEYDLPLSIMTSSNDTFIIRVKGRGLEIPLLFSNPVIEMRTTCPGERVLESCIVSNRSNGPKCCEIILPDQSFTWLRISPTVIDLEPGASCRIDIEYLPPSNLVGLKPTEWLESQLKSFRERQSEDALPLQSWDSVEGGWVRSSGMFGSVHWSVFKDSKSTEEEVFLLGASEWGIVGDWNIPVLFKDSAAPGSPSLKRLISDRGNGNSFPMYLTVQTAVMRPHLDADIKFIDFGQMAVGKRAIKRVLLRNCTDEYMPLQSSCLNAVGPFNLLNAVRGIPGGESRVLIVECKPMLPGLTVEILEIFSAQGGHRARITLKTQGVEPVVELTGLSSPLDPEWSPLGGILDFGNALAGDMVTKTFVIKNKSAFPVYNVISRAAAAGLAPSKDALYVEKNTSGVPVFTFRPEKVRIDPNESVEIEVLFWAERGRNMTPFREDIVISVGQTSGPIKICLCGRSWDRQLYVIPTEPSDEPFYKMSLEDVDMSSYDTALGNEDLVSSHSSLALRQGKQKVRDFMGISPRPVPPVTLDFADAYADGFNPKLYREVEETATSSGARVLTRKLTIGCVKSFDNRARSTGGGTFEIELSTRAKESKLFTVNTEKGSVQPDGSVVVDFSCALPRPKGIGGLTVGSWQNFPINVILKGGWTLEGELEEIKIPVILKAYLRL